MVFGGDSRSYAEIILALNFFSLELQLVLTPRRHHCCVTKRPTTSASDHLELEVFFKYSNFGGDFVLIAKVEFLTAKVEYLKETSQVCSTRGDGNSASVIEGGSEALRRGHVVG
jgi:hypothetical protein